MQRQSESGNDGSTWEDPSKNLGKPSEKTLAPLLTSACDRYGKIWVFSASTSGTYRVYYRRQLSAEGDESSDFTPWTP